MFKLFIKPSAFTVIAFPVVPFKEPVLKIGMPAFTNPVWTCPFVHHEI